VPLTRLQAIKELSDLCQATLFPELETNQLARLIDQHVRFNTWTANYAYKVGDIVVPTTPNGRMYLCIIAGTSGAIEPSFPQIGFAVGQAIADGPIPQNSFGLNWQDAGKAIQNRYFYR